MVGRERTISGEVVALVGNRAESSSGLVGQATTAVVPSGATAGNSRTRFRSGAPGESGGAQAFSSLTVVAGWAVSGNVIASVGK